MIQQIGYEWQAIFYKGLSDGKKRRISFTQSGTEKRIYKFFQIHKADDECDFIGH